MDSYNQNGRHANAKSGYTSTPAGLFQPQEREFNDHDCRSIRISSSSDAPPVGGFWPTAPTTQSTSSAAEQQ
jgi:hypothetical protein